MPGMVVKAIFKSENWWDPTCKGEDLASDVTALGEQLWRDDEPRRFEAERNLRRYGGRNLNGLFLGRDYRIDSDNARLNITKSATETLVSNIGTNRPRPKVQTMGADHSLRIRAKKLQRFLDGMYVATDLYSKGKSMFRDAVLTGTGALHFYPDLARKTVGVERVFPLELLIDHAGAVDNTPQDMFRVKFLDKAVAKVRWPEYGAEIEAATPVSDEQDLPSFSDSDGRARRMVRVYEAWHLATPFSTKKDPFGLLPGRHVLALGDCLLEDEPWEHTEFPFVFFHWSEPLRGPWGDSAASEIRGIEKEVNMLLQKVQKAMKLVGQPWILDPTGKMAAPKLTNEVGLIVPYKEGSAPPTVVNHQPVNPQLIEQMWTLHQKAYQQLGTNEFQSAAVKPPGIESGRALAQLSEEHQGRFKDVSQNYEKALAVDTAQQFVRCARDLDAQMRDAGVKEGYVIRAKAGRTNLAINWKDAYLSPDDFFCETWPSSTLPNSPAGRTEEVQRWQANGWISPQRAMTLLEFPDLDSETDLVTADTELVEWQLERMLDDGEDVIPQEFQNLTYCLQRGVYALEHGMRTGVPQSNLDKLLVFVDAARDMLAPPAPPPGPDMLGGQPNAGMTGPMPIAPQAPPGQPGPAIGGSALPPPGGPIPQ